MELNNKELRELVTNKVLSLDGQTGTKKTVRAFLVIYQGGLQVHFKYGKEFYRFNLVDATEIQKKYSELHNIR